MKKLAKSKKQPEGTGKKIAKPLKAVGRAIKKPFMWLWKFKLIRTICKPFKFIVVLGRYFKNSWTELKQVRWPNREATWGLTLAVIGYSIFFVAMIVLLDFGFDKLFKILLG